MVGHEKFGAASRVSFPTHGEVNVFPEFGDRGRLWGLSLR